MSISNAGEEGGVYSNIYREMAVYDALPPSIRRQFQDAPRNYTVLDVAKAIVAGARVETMRAHVFGLCDDVYRQAERRIVRGEPPS